MEISRRARGGTRCRRERSTEPRATRARVAPWRGARKWGFWNTHPDILRGERRGYPQQGLEGPAQGHAYRAHDRADDPHEHHSSVARSRSRTRPVWRTEVSTSMRQFPSRPSQYRRTLGDLALGHAGCQLEMPAHFCPRRQRQLGVVSLGIRRVCTSNSRESPKTRMGFPAVPRTRKPPPNQRRRSARLGRRDLGVLQPLATLRGATAWAGAGHGARWEATRRRSTAAPSSRGRGGGVRWSRGSSSACPSARARSISAGSCGRCERCRARSRSSSCCTR